MIDMSGVFAEAWDRYTTATNAATAATRRFFDLEDADRPNEENAFAAFMMDWERAKLEMDLTTKEQTRTEEAVLRAPPTTHDEWLKQAAVALVSNVRNGSMEDFTATERVALRFGCWNPAGFNYLFATSMAQEERQKALDYVRPYWSVPADPAGTDAPSSGADDRRQAMLDAVEGRDVPEGLAWGKRLDQAKERVIRNAENLAKTPRPDGLPGGAKRRWKRLLAAVEHLHEIMRKGDIDPIVVPPHDPALTTVLPKHEVLQAAADPAL